MAESDIAEATMSSVIDPTSVWLTGRVAWFDEQRGFGFIDPDGVRQWPVFVEYSCIDVPGYRALAEGQPVRYLCDPEAHGRAAAVVRPYPPQISPK
ncbi:cold shock domain-containing protein [Nocardia pseudovaccinii]|uniref:cold shock domain-containing protein n=1 Tax=Nocardia pseudovaccinii TaxID=189540 RepID=UPI000B05A74D